MTEAQMKQLTKQSALGGTVEEEADESSYWMKLDGGVLSRDQIEPLRLEACELTAIMAASRISASGNQIANRKSKI